jgi:hypothetical protein
MYAWEPSFKYQILEIRRREMNKLIKVAYLQGITTFGWLLAPVVVGFNVKVTSAINKSCLSTRYNNVWMASSSSCGRF